MGLGLSLTQHFMLDGFRTNIYTNSAPSHRPLGIYLALHRYCSSVCYSHSELTVTAENQTQILLVRTQTPSTWTSCAQVLISTCRSETVPDRVEYTPGQLIGVTWVTRFTLLGTK